MVAYTPVDDSQSPSSRRHYDMDNKLSLHCTIKIGDAIDDLQGEPWLQDAYLDGDRLLDKWSTLFKCFRV